VHKSILYCFVGCTALDYISLDTDVFANQEKYTFLLYLLPVLLC